MTQANRLRTPHPSPPLKKGHSSSGLFQKDDSKDLLKGSFRQLKVPSDPNVHNPRTSMSQLRLYQLGQDKDEGLERFNLEELRDGFFDPIYNKPANVNMPPNDNSHKKLTMKSLIYVISGGTTEQWIHRLNNVRKSYLKYWIIISKFTIAYFIGMVLCLVEKPGSWFGKYRVFLPVSVLIHHPVHSIGAQIEMTLQSIVGLVIGAGWSSLALYITTSTQPTRNHQGGILAGSLFLGLLCMAWFRAYYIRFYYMLLASGIYLIFMSSCIELDQEKVNWRNHWNIAIPYIFGLLVSLFVSLVYFPYLGTEKVMSSLFALTGSIKSLLQTFSNPNIQDNGDTILELQKSMIEKTLYLSESFREFLSGFKLSYYNDEDLKTMRNHLNFIVAPLRVIPAQTNIYFRKLDPSLDNSNDGTRVQSSANLSEFNSGVVTPQPRSSLPGQQKLSKQLYISIMDDAFNKPLFKLLAQMIETIETIEETIKKTGRLSTKSQKPKNVLLQELERSKLVLKKRIYQIDNAYRKFSRTDYFSRDLLSEEIVTNMFLFLRYSRQSAVMLMNLCDIIASSSEKVGHTRHIFVPNYPFHRSLRRLPEQCLRDQGADSVFHYFETKIDVDDAFERIYNLNTSRNQNIQDPNEKNLKSIRAIDHNDFNFHSTTNKLRFGLWKFFKKLNDSQSKYAFKVSFVVLFLSLPSWLKTSWSWYFQYHCYWAPVLVYYFLSPRNSGTWDNLFTRTICWFIGCFWGWASVQSRHFQNPFVIATFSALICSVFSYGVLVATHPRSSFVTLLSFTIVAMNGYIEKEGSTSSIFKNTWIIAVTILISVVSSILTNWVIWPFVARHELYKSCASLLSHIAQSYQSVSERYLYRDVNDDPTDLTLELANIREVRMSQSLLAIKELLVKARHEHDFTHRFNADSFELLLNSCDSILEKIIEARMSGVYFRVWEQDKDEKTSEALLSVRRDSVSTVIFILYIISNSIRSKVALPKYFPSAISVRKRLYDIISQLEVSKDTRTESLLEQLNNRLTEIGTNDVMDKDDKSYLKIHWTEVHGMAFSSAFTSITEELEHLILIAKEILGEESIMD